MNVVQIKGTVSRKPYTSEKFAAFSVKPDKVKESDRQPILDVVVFDAAPLAVASMIEEGSKVQILAHLSSKKLTDKSKAEAQIDGRPVWVLQLVVDEIDAADEATTRRIADQIF